MRWWAPRDSSRDSAESHDRLRDVEHERSSSAAISSVLKLRLWSSIRDVRKRSFSSRSLSAALASESVAVDAGAASPRRAASRSGSLAIRSRPPS